jgi:hypothetical protein
MENRRNPKYALIEGNRRCSDFFQKMNPSAAQSRNSNELMTDMAELRGINIYSPS